MKNSSKKLFWTVLVSFCCFAQASRADITSGLIAYWKFDEASGVTVADSSGRGNNASLLNFQPDDSMWVTGRIGGALEFNPPDSGDDDEVVTDSTIVLDNQDSFTFAFWARRQPGENPFNPRFITPVGDQHWVLWTPGTGVGFYVPAPTLDPPVGAWRHYVVLFDRAAGRYSVYVDGQLAVNNVAASRPEPGETQWVIGHKELLEDHRDPWRGYLDDLRMYNRVLSVSDVQELYLAAGATGPKIITPPQPATKFLGDSVVLSVVAEGTAPLLYQWRKAGTVITGATNSLLTLTNLQVSDSGLYSVAITNSIGGLVSTDAMLTVTDPPVDITSDLVLLYKFDETEGFTASDSSGNNHNATLVNTFGDGSEWVPGRIGGGISLNPTDGGEDDYVITDDFIPLENQDKFTFTFWAKAAPGPGINPRIITPTTGHWVLWAPGTGVGFYVPAASPEPIDGVWRHFAVVYDRPAGTYQLFVNGQRYGTEIPGRTRVEAGESQWVIGHAENIDATSDSFSGVLDDVRVYNRQLTGKDIAAIYALAPVEGPTIVESPKGMITAEGNNMNLRVVAGGTDVRYQWKKGTSDVIGATNDTLTLTAPVAADSGDYTVVVSNSKGQATSDPAHLTFIPVLNLAGAPATSSSDYNADFPASRAFDGLRLSTGPNSSRWASAPNASVESITVDLGEEQKLRYVFLDWEAAYGVDYILRGSVSPDGPWTDLATVSGYAQNGQGLDGADVVFDFVNDAVLLQGNTAEFPSTTIANTDEKIRYLMLEGDISAIGLYSIWELQVSVEGSALAPPELSVTRAGANITIAWPAADTGFTLESSDTLPATTWTPVTGVANNSITLEAAGRKFYRLRK